VRSRVVEEEAGVGVREGAGEAALLALEGDLREGGMEEGDEVH